MRQSASNSAIDSVILAYRSLHPLRPRSRFLFSPLQKGCKSPRRRLSFSQPSLKAAASMAGPTSSSLYHLSINDHQPTTIVLLHGLLSSHREWTYVTPILSSYHLILPDMPEHSSSVDITPFTIPDAASHVASLIKSYAHSVPCHVVGLSAGGFVALELARAHPELVESLFVTGVGGLAERRWLVAAAPYVMMAVSKLQRTLPRSLNDLILQKMGMKIPEALQRDLDGNLRFSLLKRAFASIGEYGKGSPLPMRTLAVAGGMQDNIEGTKRLGHVMRAGFEKSKAAVIDGAIHAWNLQRPELFAEGIIAWVEGSELPIEFRELR